MRFLFFNNIAQLKGWRFAGGSALVVPLQELHDAAR